jgi:hypothetical protein
MMARAHRRAHAPAARRAVDKSGNVYIAVTGDNNVRKVTTDGIINTFAGNSLPASRAMVETRRKPR